MPNSFHAWQKPGTPSLPPLSPCLPSFASVPSSFSFPFLPPIPTTNGSLTAPLDAWLQGLPLAHSKLCPQNALVSSWFPFKPSPFQQGHPPPSLLPSPPSSPPLPPPPLSSPPSRAPQAAAAPAPATSDPAASGPPRWRFLAFDDAEGARLGPGTKEEHTRQRGILTFLIHRNMKTLQLVNGTVSICMLVEKKPHVSNGGKMQLYVKEPCQRGVFVARKIQRKSRWPVWFRKSRDGIYDPNHSEKKKRRESRGFSMVPMTCLSK